ncbi:MAG: signal recognition particle-docking protein FtsY [Actinomycetota bacterium]
MLSVVLVVVVILLIALLVGFVATRRRRREVGPGEPAPVAVAEPPVVVEEPPVVVEEPPVVVERPRLRDRLGRTRSAFAGAFGRIRGRAIDDDTWDEIEEALLLADVGLPTARRILDAVRERVRATGADDADAVIGLVREEVVGILLDDADDRRLRLVPAEPNVWMFVGVNGVGKTTTIGKLAAQQVRDGRRVVLAAADTFRAAAADQLALWAERTGARIVRGQEGADPGSIVFDAMAAAGGRSADLVLVDTAGRLHTKLNLMEELSKLRRIVDRTEGACKEVLLVIDASTGQNGLVQARQFTEAVDVTGIALTKLDGTAKGGIVLAIRSELGLPVKVVGVGEGIDDLIPFDPAEFAAALFEPDGA